MDDLSIAKLELRPGDTLVVRYNRGPLSADVAERIKADIARLIPAGAEVMVIDSRFSLSVVPRQEQPPAAAA